jgi:tetratricopeptide (TPR) repeat protein
MAVAFSPDGKRVLTGSDDGTARVWDAQTGAEIARLLHEDEVNAVAFSPDGKWVLTGSRDDTARVWWIHSEDLVRSLCQRLNRNLTAEEWLSYMNKSLQQYELACPGSQVHPSLISRAVESAQRGEIKAATDIFRRVKHLEPKRDLDPETEAIETAPKAVAVKSSATYEVQEAERLARQGKKRQALDRYQEALSRNPNIDLIPATEKRDRDPEAAYAAISNSEQ